MCLRVIKTLESLVQKYPVSRVLEHLVGHAPELAHALPELLPPAPVMIYYNITYTYIYIYI